MEDIDFEGWWDGEREKAAKDYVTLGVCALRNIAMCAWEAAQRAIRSISTKDYKFTVVCPGEIGAGLRSYTEEVTISVESGDPGGDPGEFEAFLKDCLTEWFDGAGVCLIDDVE